MRRPFHPRRAERGFALIGLLALLIAGLLAFLVATLGPEAMEAYRAKKTEVALVQAKEALLGYAMRYRDMEMARDPPSYPVYGYLPLPDLGTNRNINIGCDTEGCDAGNFSGNAENLTVIGRFPWRLVGTEPLRDGYGECLWYAVSGSHKRTQPVTPMNWDTLGQLDVVVANGTANLVSVLSTPNHDQPVAIIFSAGPALPNQVRSRSTADMVDECGGNYNVANYLDPDVANALGGVTNFLGGSTNNASQDTSAAPKQIASQGGIFRSDDGTLWANACPSGSSCALASNDRGLALTPDVLFNSLRKNLNFRTDINSLLDRIVGCLRDDIAAGTTSEGLNRIQGANDNDCYGSGIVPRGYYPNYREMLFVAGGTTLVNGESCAGALLFGNQRGSGQTRATTDDKADSRNYLEGINLVDAGGPFSGQEQLERVSKLQSVSQDIVRCLPATPSFVTTQSPNIPPLAGYSPSTHTLTLGATVSTPIDAAYANYLYQCAWTPETRAMGDGLRSYFTFRINDAGFSSAPHEGFTFSIVDGDNNAMNACGAAAQHLGYSGNNTESPFIVPPKIGMEIDLRRVRGETGFNPSLPDHLANGRNDPSDYTGGHVAVVYWGGESAIDTTIKQKDCVLPAYYSAGVCRLPPEEDDNVHGLSATARAGFARPPVNPSAPTPPRSLPLPPDALSGVYKLDPDLTNIPVNQYYHVRVELTRTADTDYALPQVRVATTTTIDLSNPFTLIDGSYYFAIDGIYLFDGDRVLVKDQFDSRQNGVYVWHTGAPPTIQRATDADSTIELAGLAVEVRQGARNAHSIWRQNNANPIIDTDTLSWTNIRVKVAAPASTNLNAPGTTLDGIRMTANDRVYVDSKGVYIWHGAAVAMTPAPDVVPGSAIQVQQGSLAPAWWQFDGASWRRLVVRAATQVPLDLSNPGASIGGVTLSNGDRILVKNQGNSSENGIYVWSGAAVSMTRAADADTAEELAGALIQVLEGSDASRTFRQTGLAANGTLGTQSVRWEAIDHSSTYLFEAWILPDSSTYTNMIAAMQDTTRAMNVLIPSFAPQLRDRPAIAYPFRNVRLGFTTGQRTTITDQTITIRNIFSSWLQ